MEGRTLAFDCQASYEALQAYITNFSKFSNEHLIMQLNLREDRSLNIEQYNKLVNTLEDINQTVLIDLAQARTYYNILRTRKDINFNRKSENEIQSMWGDVVEDE